MIEITSAKIVASFGKYLVGEFKGALKGLIDVDLDPPRNGGPVELYDLTLRVLGHAVRGKFSKFMSNFTVYLPGY